jgi:hypothetical protein
LKEIANLQLYHSSIYQDWGGGGVTDAGVFLSTSISTLELHLDSSCCDQTILTHIPQSELQLLLPHTINHTLLAPFG